ncbi:polyprenyl synthetase family protein [Metabacillus fastidiosus]|uniref:polyprenyl synthetase family protein n=1 Tax=Metabacillus fastidiosus TaxID=1458 RepID=UPI0008240407|nr:farnesyl diphosphate synthase [Metabacillus fastidiosus]MED4453548.1 polyprenyl synthetase family protein [Metabacillus fastidiosus]MED4463802.1 polyprenyl synthetase family protein [Metabacillus fastidiosus]
MTVTLNDFLPSRKKIIEESLPNFIKYLEAPETLKESMLYSLNAGGKRLRPILVLATLQAYGKNEELGIAVGCAIEMLHTYSLIHDDLPCMDDDDLRRGKPTNHKVFGEALAVLAGDGLLTQCFSVIVNEKNPEVTAEMKVRLISEFVKAAGPEGMVGGQVLDMEAETKTLTLPELEYVHENKTAKLLMFSIIAGAILADASESDIQYLRTFAFHLGIAFQIRDDILDIEGNEELIGKRVGSDSSNEKTTYPSLLTMSGAKEKLAEHIAEAKSALGNVTADASLLEEICDLIASRDH